MDITLVEELDKFSDVLFTDSTHSYVINGKRAVSVTGLVGKLSKPFDSDFWSKKKAEERGCSPEDIIAEWDYKRDRSTNKGTAVHNYVEFRLARKHYEFEVDKSLPEQLRSDIRIGYNKTLPLVDKFLAESRGRLIPIRSEFVVYDSELMLSGMVDQIFFNKKSGVLEIWDWKTNAKINTESNYRLLDPVSYLDDSEYTKYSLQLAAYKKIIERNTNLKFGESRFVWFGEDNNNYLVYNCAPLEKEIDMLFDMRRSDINK